RHRRGRAPHLVRRDGRRHQRPLRRPLRYGDLRREGVGGTAGAAVRAAVDVLRPADGEVGRRLGGSAARRLVVPLPSPFSPLPVTPPLLSLSAISKRFGPVTALDGVDFAVAAGEVHALLGENGAGKSTLMHVAYGMVKPDTGAIAVDGRPVAIRSPRDARRLGLGMVHQHFTS